MTDAFEILRDSTVLEWEPLNFGDLRELTELLHAIEYVDDTVIRHDLCGVERSYTDTGPEIAERAVVGRDRGGCIVAYGWDHMDDRAVSPRLVTLEGGVHPAWRDKAIGPAILKWQIAVAKAWYQATHRSYHGPLKLVATADANLTGFRGILEANGLMPRTWYCDMHRAFDPAEPPAPPADLDGVSLRPYLDVNPDQVRAAHNEAFARRGCHAIGPGEWDASMRRSDSRPDLSWVAVAGSRVVGYALSSCNSCLGEESLAEGWIDRLGIVPGWRGRGIGTALLDASSCSFFEAGLQGSGIGFDTDEPTGRLAWYRERGYALADTVVSHELVVS